MIFPQEPYNDDYSEDDGFHQILFRPGYAVQTRELTQLQTILQKQISRHGDAIFKQGAMVIPGQVYIDMNAAYVKLQPTYGSSSIAGFIQTFKGQKITGASGLEADIIEVVDATSTDPITLYVRYKNSGTSGTTKVFADSEVLTYNSQSVQVAAATSTGKGSLASIERGVYYVNGYFVLCAAQTLVIDKYGIVPSFRIGLDILESVQTPETDEKLLDNAQGSYNYAAPGAHRLAITLTLAKRNITLVGQETDADFIELHRTVDGVIQKQINVTDYSIVEQNLARRTYDESGDYTVRNFEIDLREYRNNDRGQWITGQYYLIGDVCSNGGNFYTAKTNSTSNSVAPVHTAGVVNDGPSGTVVAWEYTLNPVYNRGVYTQAVGTSSVDALANEAKIAVALEPGKAYVRGFEIEKIATTFIPVAKPRTFNSVDNASIPSTIGNYVLVRNVNNLPPVDTFAEIILYSTISTSAGVAGTGQVGTARVRAFEYHSGTKGVNPPTASYGVYKMFLFDIKLNAGVDFNRSVKSFFYNVSSDANLSFTADIEPVLVSLIGSGSTSTTNLTGVGTSFSTDLTVGDYVYVGTDLRRIVTIPGQTSATIDSSSTQTGQFIKLVKTALLEPAASSLLFPFSNTAIKNTSDTTYTVFQKFTGTAVGTTLTLNTTNSFVPFTENNYVVIDNDATSGGAVVNASISRAPTVLTITGLPGTNRNFIVIAAVTKSSSVGGNLKTKTLVSGATATFTIASAQANKSVLSLGKADGYRLVSVIMGSVNITDRYIFDDGQKDSFYDVAKIVLKPSYSPPTADITVTFDYFTHSSGDYFSVESYSTIDYKAIPSFLGTSLRDVLDFRPRIDDAGATFTGTGAVLSLIPKRGFDTLTDYSYYIGRKTKVLLDKLGNFYSVDGTPAAFPNAPETPADGMLLYTLSLSPYTFAANSQQISIDRIDNKRYTMRDIGRLEKRIDNLEYYTTLSLLEQETANLSIKDSSGFDRFKNGFIVDAFTGQSVGDVTSADYACAVDMENGELRPYYTMENVSLIEKQSTDGARASANYKLYGDVITLPVLSHEKLIEQPYGTGVENVNPFAVITFVGKVNINPSSDDWFEVERKPDLVQNAEGNFAAVAAGANASGILGTVWNAWQTQWGGSFPDSATALANSTPEIFGNTAVVSRTGIRTSLVTKVDRVNTGDRVLSVAAIPFIRPRNVLVQTSGLKPNTRFYPFFDGVNVTSYVTPSSIITYTATTGTFDGMTNVGGNSSEVERRISGNAQVCLNRGDILRGFNSGAAQVATAVVVGVHYKSVTVSNVTTITRTLSVQNIIGSFATAVTLTGSVSGATGGYVSIVAGTLGGTLTSNHNGDLNVLFAIPSTDSLRFRTGARIFELTDSATNGNDKTSRGRGRYVATGLLETRQGTIVATRNAEIVTEKTTETIVQVVAQQSEGGRSSDAMDPLAQTFLVEQKGGAFLTKVDVFVAFKDENIPLRMEIREVINGYPGAKILPFSSVALPPEKVNISGTTVLLDTIATPTFDTPTTFNFPSPVFVEQGKEYCVVLLTDSNKYKVWISQMGEIVPGTDRTVSEQPSLGVLFKSQNASAWTADQNQDLMFTLYRAKFDTAAVAAVEFVNNVIPTQALVTNPFETKNGSNKVRVYQRNHGMSAGSSVTIASASTAAINGIPYTELYKTHTAIADVDFDSYTVTSTTNASGDAYAGGSGITATRNVQYDALQPAAQVQTFPDCAASFSVKTTSGKSVDSTTQTAYTLDSGYTGIQINDTNYFRTPRLIASQVNETASVGGAKSFSMVATMSTTNDALSPIIDTQRISLYAIGNKINKPTETNVNVSGIDDRVAFTAQAVTFTTSSVTSTVTAVRDAFKALSIGKSVAFSGGSNTGTFTVSGTSDDGTTGTLNLVGTLSAGGSTVTMTNRMLFVDDIAPVGASSLAKYPSKRINLVNASTFLKIKFAANIPAESDVLVYYKTSSVGATQDLGILKYTLATPEVNLVKSDINDTAFYDASYSITGLNPFDGLQVKLVFQSTNSSAVPRVKDLRIVACA